MHRQRPIAPPQAALDAFERIPVSSGMGYLVYADTIDHTGRAVGKGLGHRAGPLR
jgi:hypothetical protein